MKYIILFIIVFSIYSFRAQIEITPFVTYNYRLTKTKAEYTSDTSFYVKYANKVLPEIGLSLTKKRVDKFDYGVGISWKRYDYSYNLQYKIGFLGRKDYRSRTISVDALGLRVFTKYKLSETTNLCFILEGNIPYKTLSTVENKENFSYYLERKIVSSTGEVVQESSITVKERQGVDFSKFYNYIVPEINFQTKIFENINVYYGAKLKVWSIYNLYLIKAWGYYDINEEYKPLFTSEVDSKKIFLYFGLSYSIKTKSNKKSS